MIFLYMLLAHVFALHAIALAIYLFPSERQGEMSAAQPDEANVRYEADGRRLVRKDVHGKSS